MTKMFSLALLTCTTLVAGCSLAVDVDRRQIPDDLYNVPEAGMSEEEAGTGEEEDAGAVEDDASVDGAALTALSPLQSLDAGLDAAP